MVVRGTGGGSTPSETLAELDPVRRSWRRLARTLSTSLIFSSQVALCRLRCQAACLASKAETSTIEEPRFKTLPCHRKAMSFG